MGVLKTKRVTGRWLARRMLPSKRAGLLACSPLFARETERLDRKRAGEALARYVPSRALPGGGVYGASPAALTAP